jgi:predicted HAD superfamily Cof-like phosphohydrolase
MTQEEVMSHEGNMVAQFIRTFKASLDLRLWVKLMWEELSEYNESEEGSENALKEIADLLYVRTGFILVLGGGVGEGVISEEEEQEWKALLGEVSEAFVSAEKQFSTATIWEAFKRVHLSNMSKLGDDGKPILREDGKIMKGPNYKEPDLTDLLKESTIT